MIRVRVHFILEGLRGAEDFSVPDWYSAFRKFELMCIHMDLPTFECGCCIDGRAAELGALRAEVLS